MKLFKKNKVEETEVLDPEMEINPDSEETEEEQPKKKSWMLWVVAGTVAAGAIALIGGLFSKGGNDDYDGDSDEDDEDLDDLDDGIEEIDNKTDSENE